MYSVYQPWDPLRVCAVGKCYDKDFFKFIEHPQARYVMERIAEETEEDLQNFISLLKKFDVSIIRPDICEKTQLGNSYLPPPLAPRDDTGMIGNQFFSASPNENLKWSILRGDNWPINPPRTIDEWENLPGALRNELKDLYNVNSLIDVYDKNYKTLTPIINLVEEQGNEIIYDTKIDTAMTCRIGKDLYFGTWPTTDHYALQSKMEELFPHNRCHIVQSNGHLDGTICPITEGLIFSTREVSKDNLSRYFPGWEVVYIDAEFRNAQFKKLKKKNKGKWWVPGEETNNEFTMFVERYIQNWVGYCEETVIGVNLLILDKKNVICTTENQLAFDVFSRYNITPHIVKFRHQNFWDSGWHCLTSDLHRDGAKQDYFPERSL